MLDPKRREQGSDAMPTGGEFFKNLRPGWRLQVHDHTRDACDREHIVTIKSATDGGIRLEPGDTKFCKIRDRYNYERSGGFTGTAVIPTKGPVSIGPTTFTLSGK